MKKCVIGIILLCGLMLLGFGCSGGAKELYDTAQLEELQNNKPHAKKLYQELIEKYPSTEYAKKAAEQLKKIDVAK